MKRKRKRTNSYAAFTAVICIFVMLMIVLASSIARTPPTSPETDGGTDARTEAPTASMTDSMTEKQTDPASEESTAPETDPPPEDKVREYGAFSVSGRFIPSEDAVAGLEGALDAFGRPTGFVAIDIETGMSVYSNEEKAFAPASAIKAVVALYAFRQIDAGEASLDETLTYTSKDKVYGDGAIGRLGIGAKLSLRDVLYHTLNTSDNEGYYMLLRRFGRKNCDRMTAELGCTTGRLADSRWPAISAKDLALIWAEIYRYRDETEGGRLFYDMLTHVEKMHFFRDALGVKTANKSGWNDSSYNEGAIVYGERTYILVVLTEGSYWTANKTQFGDIVRAIDGIMSEYK